MVSHALYLPIQSDIIFLQYPDVLITVCLLMSFLFLYGFFKVQRTASCFFLLSRLSISRHHTRFPDVLTADGPELRPFGLPLLLCPAVLSFSVLRHLFLFL